MEKGLLISQAALPPGSLAERSFRRIDYKEAYRCDFSCARPLAVEEVVKVFFIASPGWVGQLFLLRNKLAGLFGLKVPEQGNPQLQLQQFQVVPGESMGFFKVMAKTGAEVLLGENDKHLDFRISFYLTRQKEQDAYRLILSTTVCFHNRFGRLYFLPVKPMHKLIVKAMLKSVVDELQKQGPQFNTAWINPQQGSPLVQ